MTESQAAARINLAVDTSVKERAVYLVRVAKEAGAKSVKLGLEVLTAISPKGASELAGEYGLEWTADAKLHDIPNTVKKTVEIYAGFEHPPTGITVHTSAGNEAMRLAQASAGSIKMLGVTVLTSIKDPECKHIYNGLNRSQKVPQFAADAAFAKLAGVVCSPLEVGAVKQNPVTRNLYTMIPAIRSAGAESNDQAAIGTPTQAIQAGADLLVIGRQITEAYDPALAYQDVINEIMAAA